MEIVYAVVDAHASIVSGPYDRHEDACQEARYCRNHYQEPFYVVSIRSSQFGPPRRAGLPVSRERVPEGPPDRLDARLALMIAESREGV